jgi:hypothetical protein
MNNIKKFWEKLNYWQKGGVVGAIFGLIILLLIWKLAIEPFTLSNEVAKILVGVPTFLALFIPVESELTIYVFVLGIVFYSLIGILIGLIIGKVKRK